MFYIGLHRYCGNLFLWKCSRKFCLLSTKVRKFLPSKVSSIEILLYRRQDKERRCKTSFHFSNNFLNNFVSSACLLLQNLHGMPNVSHGMPTWCTKCFGKLIWPNFNFIQAKCSIAHQKLIIERENNTKFQETTVISFCLLD